MGSNYLPHNYAVFVLFCFLADSLSSYSSKFCYRIYRTSQKGTQSWDFSKIKVHILEMILNSYSHFPWNHPSMYILFYIFFLWVSSKWPKPTRFSLPYPYHTSSASFLSPCSWYSSLTIIRFQLSGNLIIWKLRDLETLELYF